MKKILLLLFASLFICNYSYSKNICCHTYTYNGGDKGYYNVDEGSSTIQDVEYHWLSCREPGENNCKWKNGDPCATNIACPIRPDIIVTDDNGVIINLDISEINKEIIESINNGKYNGGIFFKDQAQIFFIYEKNDTSTDLKVSILTGSNMIKF